MYKPRSAINLNPIQQTDIGQGIYDLIHELQKKSIIDMKSAVLDFNNKTGKKNTIFEKLIIFLKEILSPSKNDFYAWVNYLRYSFLLDRKKNKKIS